MTRSPFPSRDRQGAVANCTCSPLHLYEVARLARPEGLEPPAYWFEAKNPQETNDLHLF